MAIRLSLDDIQAIYNTVSELQDMKGAKIRQVEVRGHVVYLDRMDGQRDGGEYYVVGIANNPPLSSPQVTRGRAHSLGDPSR